MLVIDFPDEHKVLVKMGGESILIDAQAEFIGKNWLFINGNPVNPKLFFEKVYKIDYVNKDKPIKRRLKTIKDGDFILVVDISTDNKVFFLWFPLRGYLTFRCPPMDEWSYHKGKWYHKDKIKNKHVVERVLYG